MRFRAVVFDLDGTLLNTLADLAEAMNRVLQSQGLPEHPTDAYRQFVGNGATKLVMRALPPDRRTEAEVAAYLKQFKAMYREGWRSHTMLYEGIADMLDALCAKGLKLVVLTNKPQAFAELCVQEFLSAWRFDVILGQRDGIPMKPDPAGPSEILRRLALPAEACLYLGDSDVDMYTAVNAGMYSVGVTWGFRAETELRDAGAQVLIHQPMDVLTLVD